MSRLEQFDTHTAIKVTNERGLIDEAKAVTEQRQAVYGSPQDNFERTARLWGGYLAREISTADVANLMILLKIARLQQTPKHHDSLVDLIGYTICASQLDT